MDAQDQKDLSALVAVKCAQCAQICSFPGTGLCPECLGEWDKITAPEREINRRILHDWFAWRLHEEKDQLNPKSPHWSRSVAPKLRLDQRDKPDYCYTSGCPLATQGIGFALGCGDPSSAEFGVILEAIGKDEGLFRLVAPERPRGFYDTARECNDEIAIRKRDYPELPDRFIRQGVPVVGKAGALLFQWLFAPLGIKRNRLFIDNTLRCLPPKSGKSGDGAPYPVKDERKAAERCCRHFDRLHLFRPDTFVFSLHPAALTREVTPLPLVLRDVEKSRDFAAQGRRVCLLFGGKAIKAFARYGEAVTRWRGEYCALVANWWNTYKQVFESEKAKQEAAYSLDFMLGGSAVEMKKARNRRIRKEKKAEAKKS